MIQCMPDSRELQWSDRVKSDPFSEDGSTPVAGLVQRYHNRVLLMATDQCAVRCRHCTRKNVLGRPAQKPTRARYREMLAHIREMSDAREVLISGGDPLLLETELLDWLLSSLRAIEHVEVLRIGTRVPVVLPMRMYASWPWTG